VTHALPNCTQHACSLDQPTAAAACQAAILNQSVGCVSLPAPLLQEEKEATARLRAWRKLELDGLELYAHMLKQCASGARPPKGKGKKAAAAAAAAAAPAAKRQRRDGGGGEAAGGSAAAAGTSGAAAAAEKPTKEVLQAQVLDEVAVLQRQRHLCRNLAGPLLRPHSDHPLPSRLPLFCPACCVPALLRLCAAGGNPAAAGGAALRPAAAGRRAG
jgi:hypothetical protein